MLDGINVGWQRAVTCLICAAECCLCELCSSLVHGSYPCLQDLSMHKEEIHAKLVAIMRERLSNSLKQLPAVAMSWGVQGAPATAHVPPSSFAQTNAKQLRVLSQVHLQVLQHVVLSNVHIAPLCSANHCMQLPRSCSSPTCLACRSHMHTLLYQTQQAFALTESMGMGRLTI